MQMNCPSGFDVSSTMQLKADTENNLKVVIVENLPLFGVSISSVVSGLIKKRKITTKTCNYYVRHKLLSSD